MLAQKAPQVWLRKPSNRDGLRSTSLSGNDFDVCLCDTEHTREKLHQVTICPVLEWWGSESDLDGISVQSGNLIPRGPRLEMNRKADLPVTVEESWSAHRQPLPPPPK